MQLLDHILNDQGYTVRVWLDEIAPDAIETYTWGPYKQELTQQSFDTDGNPLFDEAGNVVYESIPWEMSKKKYEAEHIDQAMKLAAQKLAQLNPQPVVISENIAAKEEQQAAVEALEIGDSEIIDG